MDTFAPRMNAVCDGDAQEALSRWAFDENNGIEKQVIEITLGQCHPWQYELFDGNVTVNHIYNTNPTTCLSGQERCLLSTCFAEPQGFKSPEMLLAWGQISLT